MRTKLGGNVTRLMTHYIVNKRKFTKDQDGGCRHLELRKTFAMSSLLDLFSPNLVGMLQIFDVECNCFSQK